MRNCLRYFAALAATFDAWRSTFDACRPQVRRFVHHFEGGLATNNREHPEWAYMWLLKALADAAPSLALLAAALADESSPFARLTAGGGAAKVGLGHSVALYYHSSTSYHIC